MKRKALLTVAAVAAIWIPDQASALMQVVPGYYPHWDTQSSPTGPQQWAAACLDTNPSGVGSIAILNPNSGPGPSKNFNANYETEIQVCHDDDNDNEHFTNVIGYVSTGYGSRSMSAVKADIDTWYEWYGGPDGLDGIFLDEMQSTRTASASGCDSSCGGTNDATHYYQAIHAYVDSVAPTDKNEVIGNPGVVPLDNSVASDWPIDDDAVDKVVAFEGTGSTFSTFTMPSVLADLPDNDVIALVHSISSQNDFNTYKMRASNQHFGHFYGTDLTSGNPWLHPSAYDQYNN